MPPPEIELRDYLLGAGDRAPPVLGSFELRDCECGRSEQQPLSLWGVIFGGDVLFENVIFNAPLHMSAAEFRGSASFKNCIFTDANFTGARFRQGADFTMSAFRRAYFWRALFGGPAMMQEIKVHPGETGDRRNSVFNGEANFSYARFGDEANFALARLTGPTYFVGTRFLRRATFRSATLDGPLTFETQLPDRVTIAANDFADVMRGVWPGSRSAAMPKLSPEEAARIWATPPDGLFHRLLSAGVLKMSGEHGAVPPADPRAIAYADFPPPDKSEKAWKEQLGLFTSSEQAIFAIVLDALARPMFPGDHDVSFEGVTFAAPAFKNVDLSRCLFRDVNLDQLVVENVTWGSRRLIFWRRATLHDESYANTTQDFARMLSVYSTIKGRYDAIKDTRAADAFYRSEMEMERLAGSPLRLLHKYLNAYNTSLALPLFWLLLFCFAIFPLLYWSTGTVSSFGDGIIHTLFLASFTKLAAAAKTTVAGLALQTLQLATFGILVFSVVSIFKRRLRWS